MANLLEFIKTNSLKVFAFLVLAVFILAPAWPVSGYFLAGCVAWFFLSAAKNAWAKAAASIMGPVTIGLAIVAIILAAVNSAMPKRMFSLDTPTEAAKNVAKVEKLLLWLDVHLPAWTKIPAWAVIAILVVLTVVSYHLPKLSLVGKFVWLKKRAGQAVSVVAVATSFTFFSNDAVFEPLSGQKYTELVALFRESQEREQKSIAKWLAATSLRQAVIDSPPYVHVYYREMIRMIYNLKSRDNRHAPPSRKESVLSDYVQTRPLFSERIENGSDEVLPEVASPAPPKDKIASELEKQYRSEEARRAAANQAEQGVKAVLNELIGLGNDKLTGWLETFGNLLLYSELGARSKWLTKYLSKVTEKQIEAALEPIRDQMTSDFRRVLSYGVDPKSDPRADLLKLELGLLPRKVGRLDRLLASEKKTRALENEINKALSDANETADNILLLSEQGTADGASKANASGHTDKAKEDLMKMKKIKSDTEKTKAALSEVKEERLWREPGPPPVHIPIMPIEPKPRPRVR